MRRGWTRSHGPCVFAALLFIGLLSLTGGAWANSYSTTFPKSENPISEKGAWINGGTAGVDWSNVQTTTGLAFGTQTGFINYNDSVAILAGTWSADQSATATVHSVNQVKGTANVVEEVEILLRFSIEGHDARGYEATFGLGVVTPAMCK